MDDLLKAIERAGLEIVNRAEGDPLAITLFCRCPEDTVVHALFDRLLAAKEKQNRWDCHLCRRYIRKDGKMLYTWNLQFAVTAEDLWAEVAAAARGDAVREETEFKMPMLGAGRDRGAPAPGKTKGAYAPNQFRPPSGS